MLVIDCREQEGKLTKKYMLGTMFFCIAIHTINHISKTPYLVLRELLLLSDDVNTSFRFINEIVA